MRGLVKSSLGGILRKRTLSRFLAVLALFALNAKAGPKPPPVNIMKFSNTVVKGDYTKAIRLAVAEAAKTRGYAIYFPAGHYSISDTIDLNSATPISGGDVAIQQRDPQKDIFYADKVWRRTIKGFAFTGGRDQIAIGNKNVDQGFLIISDCKFKNASGAAIRFIRKAKGETASTYCLVEKCHFSNCVQAVISVSDKSTIRDCWISTSSKNKKNLAVIENYGVLKCENILGVPRVTSTDQRWIDNHGCLICENFRFGGEGGGFTPVVNYARFNNSVYGNYVIILNSYISALGNNKRPCAVYCEEAPNMIVVENCDLCGVPALKVVEKIEHSAYFKGARPGMLRYSISRNIGEFAGDLPEAMLKAAANRKVANDYGEKQLTAKQTAERLRELVILAPKYNSPSGPLVARKRIPKGARPHKRKVDGAIDLAPPKYEWSLDDCLGWVSH